MINFEKPPLPERGKEKEQTLEEIRKILEEALSKEALVDLMILNTGGEPEPISRLIVEEIENDYVMMSYFDANGNLGEGIPLELRRIKKAELIP